MTTEDQKNIRTFVEGVAVSAITQPSQRDLQRAPGPSDLADKCDVCVAKKIASSLGIEGRGDRGFSLKAWLGTAVHEKLERDLDRIYPHAEQEITVEVAEVPGLGLVKGHIDLYLPKKLTIVDWKTTDLKKLKEYRSSANPSAYTMGLTAQERAELDELRALERGGLLKEEQMARLVGLIAASAEQSGGVPDEYMGQTMLYLRGLRRSGRQADYAVLVFIPRDSNNVEDIWVTSCAYRDDVAEGVLRRAEKLTSMVRDGRASELSPHPKCFPCVIRPRLRR